ncbi:uncharacterized protein LOC129579659 [Sitodiplosis mosellana]|uniref:uncharacterized protein LOC129579659 n=1 Tax=Sitodiplosis mosellana TaxID=263140 RepID=UPI002444E185|nr:uncharacterized protein LOC129579659 [Sitodiplosis mosellana]
MILTDLNIDCLEGILEHLKYQDLLNVADSNGRLRHASKFVFVEKYANYEFKFDSDANCRDKDVYPSRLGKLNIEDLKTVLQTLRIFGSLITRIDCIVMERPYITDYINEFCSETVSDIRFVKWRDGGLNYFFKKSFTRTKTVCIVSNGSNEQNSKLAEIFPRMQNLTLYAKCSSFMHSGYIVNHFPHLEYFKITPICLGNYIKDTECFEVLRNFLKLNPQLKYLFMDCNDHAAMDILQVFAENERKSKHLELRNYHSNFSNIREKIYLRNVKQFTIAVRYIEKIPFLFDQLETFEIDSWYPLPCIYDFLQNNSTIKKLKICINDLDYSKLISILPLVEEITDQSNISVDAVFHVITMFKYLKYFCFMNRESEQFKARLNDGWSIQNREKIYRSGVNREKVTLKRQM